MTITDYTFSAGEGRSLIRDVAKPLGWSEGMGTEQKIGLAAALFAGGLILVMGDRHRRHPAREVTATRVRRRTGRGAAPRWWHDASRE